MNAMRNFIGQELIWIRTKLTDLHFELHGGELVLATLDVDSWSHKATAVITEGKLEIRQDSKLNPITKVYSTGINTPLATIQVKWTGGGGILDMADGRTFIWKNKALLMSKKHVWMNAQNQELIHWEAHTFDENVVVLIDPAAAALPELPMLVIAGMYVTAVLRQ